MRRLGLILMMVLTMGSSATAALSGGEVRVFAAASLGDVMADLVQDFESQYPGRVILNIAGSNTLRLQIEKGAGCDVFISADLINVKLLRRKGLVRKDEYRPLLMNRLVVVSGRKDAVPLSGLEDLVDEGIRRIALADPKTVPAGIYAEEALVNAGIWESVRGRIAPTSNVRAALVHVERGNAEYGIVYQTDARMSERVRIVYEIPSRFHTAIRYGLCLIKDRSASGTAEKFYSYLASGRARRIFRQHGFMVL